MAQARKKPLIEFNFDGKRYSVSRQAHDEDLAIQLPEGSYVKAAGWYGSDPPVPEELRLVRPADRHVKATLLGLDDRRLVLECSMIKGKENGLFVQRVAQVRVGEEMGEFTMYFPPGSKVPTGRVRVIVEPIEGPSNE